MSEVENSLSKNIVAARKQAGLTQNKLAELVGVSLRTVQRWESGEREPFLREFFKIVKATKVTSEDLLSGVL